ncbi:multidrug efflux pump BexA [Filimonas lacunae]|nr:multidrug efflux pump BexA [Filimonas lacunae]
MQVGIHNRQIFTIALPIAASMVVPQINFITNNIFLGGVGEQSLAIAGITGVYYLIFAVIGGGLNNGLQSLIARRAGENRPEAIGGLFQQGVRIALGLALMGILITYLIAPTVLRFSLSNEKHVSIALRFLYIRIWGLPFLYIYQMRNALLVGINQSRFLVIGTLAETIINITLDYSLINGHWGLPKMGFDGAAVASVIAEAGGLVVIFAVMRNNGIIRKLQLFKKIPYSTATNKLILQQSAPLILQYALSIVAWEFFYILIEHHGERELAISNAMRNIFGLFGCVTWSLAATSNAMVSNIIGQGLQNRVIELVWKIARLSLGFALIIFIVLNIFPTTLLKVYGQSEDFIKTAIPVVRIVSGALLLQSIATVWLNAVVGTGYTRINLFSESLAIICYCIYVYIVLEKMHLSIRWGWVSEWLYWLVIFIPSFWFMMSGKWKNKRI